MCSFDREAERRVLTMVVVGRGWPARYHPQVPATRLHTSAAVHHHLGAFG